ncbi:MAG TPA: hypothetical protein VKQ72_00750 [Aggregatilineales bacterium]|nr:hypothetical protein [Aggregatilineales bacterium]
MVKRPLLLGIGIIAATVILQRTSVFIASQTTITAINVLTNRDDISRSNVYAQESILKPSNVTPSTFGRLFTRAVQGDIYAQPLYVSGLVIPGKGTRNVVFVATAHNVVYAFDADDPAQSAPLWMVSFGDPFTANLSPNDIWDGEDGVLGTPVIDLDSDTLYVVAHHNGGGVIMDSEASAPPVPYHDLHALDIATGAEKFGGPVRIEGSSSGSGWGSANGVIPFDSNKHLQRPGLLLLNGALYIAFGSTHDDYPSHGWIFAYNAHNLSKNIVWNVTPTVGMGGIWQSGAGIASDGKDLFVSTGNGSYDGRTDFGDSVLKLNPSLVVLDWFTPSNQCYLNEYDRDMGSTGPVFVPETGQVIAGNKQGDLYILDETNLGKYAPNQPCDIASDPDDNPQIPEWAEVGNGAMFDTPIYWNSPQLGPLIFTWTSKDTPKSFSLDGGLIPLPLTPLSAGVALSNGTPGDTLALSTNGSLPGTAILWGSQVAKTLCAHCGVLYAWDANDLSKQLWSSEMNTTRDSYGNVSKFNSPTIANGKVYVGTFSNRLDVYGLLN